MHQAASAAWNMGEWDQMAEYVSRLDDGDETKLRSLGNTAASGDGSSSGTFYRALLLVRKGKVPLTWRSIFYVVLYLCFFCIISFLKEYQRQYICSSMMKLVNMLTELGNA